MKNKILAVIGGTIALFGLGYLIYVLGGFHGRNGSDAVTIFNFDSLSLAPIILMEVLYATLMMLIYSRWTQIKTFSTGAQAGLIIGAFIGVGAILEVFALTTNVVEISGIITAGITFGVRFALAGGVIGWFLGKE
jgi:hypothetical protein